MSSDRLSNNPPSRRLPRRLPDDPLSPEVLDAARAFIVRTRLGSPLGSADAWKQAAAFIDRGVVEYFQPSMRRAYLERLLCEPGALLWPRQLLSVDFSLEEAASVTTIIISRT